MRKILALLSILTFVVSAQAETHYKSHVSIGAHAGMDLSQITFSPSVKESWNPGITGGLSIRYAEEKIVGILAEINFAQRGWRENFEGAPISYSRTLNYVTLPIMTHIYFGPPRFKCIVNLGPEFALMLSDSYNSNFDIYNPLSDSRWPSKNRMTEQLSMKIHSNFDYGITAGIGFEFYLTPRNSIYAEGRFYYGLGNVFAATKADTFSASRNMSIAVTLGYNFRIK